MDDTKHQGVTFTRQQVEYLEKQYPEVSATGSTSEAELRHRSGQRSVVLFIRAKLSKQQEN